MAIIFSEADRKFSFRERRKLKAFIEGVLCASEGNTIVRLCYVFCSDEFLLDINLRFLNHDYYTDIITFDLRAGGSVSIEGEVYVSVDRVRENATLLRVALNTEFLRVLFHGVLHLCGYTDKTKAQKAEMRQMEDKYLLLYRDFVV